MPHTPEKIARLKQLADLPALLRSQGHSVTTHGKNLTAHCPFHADSTPSFILTKKSDGWIWHCMGCSKAGDIYNYIAHKENLTLPHDFPKAVEALERWLGEHTPQTRIESTSTDHAPHTRIESQSPEHIALLNQVAEYYHQTLLSSKEGTDYLKERGIYSPEAISTFKLGYSDQSLYKLFPKTKKVDRKLLSELGILRERSFESLSRSLVFPLFNADGQVVQMYARRTIKPRQSGFLKHLYLPGKRCGLFNRSNLNASEIILCESLIDALSFYVNGHPNVMAAYGVNGLSDEHIKILKDNKVHRVYIAYDADKAGDQGAQEAAKTLHSQGIECLRVNFPRSMDANLYVLKMKPANKALSLLIQSARPLLNGKAVSYGSCGIGKVRPSTGVLIESESIDNNIHREELTPKKEKENLSLTQETCEKDTDKLFSSLVVDQSEKENIQIKKEELTPKKEKENLSLTQETYGKEGTPNLSPSLAVQNTIERTVIDTLVFHIPGGHRIRLGERAYEIYGLDQNLSRGRLKVSVSAECAGKIHSDSIDFWISSQQERFIERGSKNLSLHADILQFDIIKIFAILKVLQNERICEVLEKRQSKKPIIILTENERASALEYLKAPGLMRRIAEDFSRCGLVGEDTNALMGYLIMVSRLLYHPLAIIIQSSSSAGKSTLMEKLLAMFPCEFVEQFSTITGKSLFYWDEDLSHKILAISEEEGMDTAKYAVKILQSEGKLKVAYPARNPRTGELETRYREVKGPVVFLITTTNIEIDEEVENRCIVVTINESREQTRLIHELQRYKRSWEGLGMRETLMEIQRLHQNAQRLLKPYEIYNPYSKKLTFIDNKLRTRRDQEKYLTVIDSIALLHQYQREIRKKEINGQMQDVVVATIEDIEWANRLCNEVMGSSLNDLSPQTQNLLDKIHEMVACKCAQKAVEQKDYHFSRREVREYTGIGETQLRKHFERLEKMEYVVAHRGKQGGLYVYELLYKGEGKDGNKFLLGLLEIEKLKKMETNPNARSVTSPPF